MKSFDMYIKHNVSEGEFRDVFVSCIWESTPSIMVFEDEIYQQNIEADTFEKTTVKDFLQFIYYTVENNVSIGYKGDVLKVALIKLLLDEIKENTLDKLIEVLNEYNHKIIY